MSWLLSAPACSWWTAGDGTERVAEWSHTAVRNIAIP